MLFIAGFLWCMRREHKALSKERKEIGALLKDESLRWDRIIAELEKLRSDFGDGPLGRRRTAIARAPEPVVVATAAFVEREAITVVLSEKGWIRVVRGHPSDSSELKFK